MAGRTETAEGNDVKMMLHYYSRLATIEGLQSSLEKASREGGRSARVMSVLDAVRGSSKSLYWDDLDLKKNFSVRTAASHCIAMNDIALQVVLVYHNSIVSAYMCPGPCQQTLECDVLPCISWIRQDTTIPGASMVCSSSHVASECSPRRLIRTMRRASGICVTAARCSRLQDRWRLFRQREGRRGQGQDYRDGKSAS